MILKRMVRSGVVTVLALGLVSAASAGGDSIASAPEVPLGQRQVVSSEHSDVWRVTLKTNDLLVIDYGTIVSDPAKVNICVLGPSVTDYTAPTAPCIVHTETDGKSELRMAARTSGRYTIVLADHACDDDQGTTGGSVGCKYAVQYELTAYVKHLPHATIAAPNLVRVGSPFVVRGAVSGVSSGKVLVQARRAVKSAPWKTLAIAPLGKNGAFAVKARVAAAGSYQLQVAYPGDDGHLPSVATRQIRVA
jgi:hypothetical protein